MSNGEISETWDPRHFPSQGPYAILTSLPRGINSKVLLVGPKDSAPPDFSLSYGIPVNFTSIGAAMAAIPLLDPDVNNPVTQWTILVTPGYYPEVIKFKPFVNVVGLVKEAVIIAGQTEDIGPLRSQVYLCSRSLLTNVTLAIRPKSEQGDFVVRGHDVHTYSSGQHVGNIHFLGLSNVDFFCFRHPKDPKPKGGLIKFDGDWSTVIFKDVGGNYEAPERYGIQLFGRFQNADCHFINCFFDALFLNDEGGLMAIRNCYEVHLRNSLLRVNYLNGRGTKPITAVKISKRPVSSDELTHVAIEGSSLYGPGPSVLDIGKNTVCFFRHSWTESKSGPGQFVASRSDGIGNA